MTREQFIRRWLANPAVQYDTKTRDEMRDDLDKVIKQAGERICTECNEVVSHVSLGEMCPHCMKDM